MKCINIFAQDQTFLRPKSFQLTSFIIDDEDQITSHKSKKNLKNGHLALYADRYCCRFTVNLKLREENSDKPELMAVNSFMEIMGMSYPEYLRIRRSRTSPVSIRRMEGLPVSRLHTTNGYI